MAESRPRRITLWQDTIQTEVDVRGSGPPLVYLHGAWGLDADAAFVDALAETSTVYAPRHPGTTPGDPSAIHRLGSLHDLVVYYAELFERLELSSAPLVGHSVGGMVALEIAAVLGRWPTRLVLIDTVGLWRDDAPVRNWMILSEPERGSLLFADPEGEAARRFFAVPDEPNARAETLAGTIWAQACTGKFVWPIPDKGLARRIHRVRVPTLVVWGTQDGIVPAVYADEIARRIPGARVEWIERTGHLPHLEQPGAVAGLAAAFLRD